MRKRPFLLLACMFLAGILMQRYRVWAVPPLAFLACVFVWRMEEGRRRWLLLALMGLLFAAGVFRMGEEMHFRSAYLPELKDGQEVRLLGEVVRIERKSRCVYVYLTNCVLSSRVPCNDVLVYASADECSVGEILLVRGKIALFDEAANEGGFDARAYYQSQRIDFGLKLLQLEQVRGEGRDQRWKQTLLWFRERLERSLTACGGEAGILSAMLIGEKSSLDAEVKNLYQMAGISHILAISGLHVTLLGIGFYRFLRRVGLRYLSAGGCTAVFMLSYGVMTGGSVPTRRAVGMLLVLLAADVLGRGYDMVSALGLLCIVLLWENPFLIEYSGFWFSVSAVLGAGAAGPVLAAWAGKKGAGQDEDRKTLPGEWLAALGSTLRNQILVSLGIQLVTLPLVAYCYYEIPVYALLLNTAVLALLPYLLGLGCLAAVVGMWSVPLGSVFMMPCNVILRIYEQLCRVTLGWPHAQVITGCPCLWQMGAYYGLLALALWLMHHGTRNSALVLVPDCAAKNALPEQGKAGQGTALLLRKAGKLTVLALGSLALFLVLSFRPRGGFEMDVLDVGQGDGIYLHLTNGDSMFIDGGSSSVASVGAYRILPFLKYRGVKQISYWFVSHADEDHVSGLMEVLESGYPVEHLVFARAARQDERTVKLAALAAGHGTEVLYLAAGDALASKSVVLRCLYPGADEEGVGTDVNDLSLVLLLECGGIRGLFTGDISADIERRLLAGGCIVPVDFYKAAHHGSKYSNSEEFLLALSPAVSAISCGANNRYGHPGAAAVAHMEEAGSLVYRTDWDGQIKLWVTDGRLQGSINCN